MRWLQLVLVLVITVSCKNDEIYYTHNNTTIKRVDTDGKSTFYYLKKGVENGKIWAKYSGINDGFRGYLKFEENGKVFLLSGDGYFQTKDIDTTLFNFKEIGAADEPGDYPNVCEIWFPFETEISWNQKSKTKVKVVYPAPAMRSVLK